MSTAGRHDAYELDELLGAYALDAVDPDERRRVDDYLAINPRARQEVAEHREVATMLAFTGMDAPIGVWDRIASSIEGPAPRPGPELAKLMPITEARSRRRSPWRSVGAWAAATAAAAAVAIVAVGVFDRAEAPAPQDALAQAVTAALADPDSREANLRSADGSLGRVRAIVDENGYGYLLADDLPVLPAERTYQLWGVLDGEVISLGVLGPDPGLTVFSAGSDPASAATLTTLVITEEVAGGVAVSEQPALLAGDLI
jgi:anti-sigma-K factor RskA